MRDKYKPTKEKRKQREDDRELKEKIAEAQAKVVKKLASDFARFKIRQGSL